MWRPRSDAAASDLGLHCLSITHKHDDMFIWAKLSFSCTAAGKDPGFLERGFIYVKVWGVALLILSQFS